MEDCSQGAFVLFESFLECVSCSDILATLPPAIVEMEDGHVVKDMSWEDSLES